MKQCTSCKQFFPATTEFFGLDNQKFDGLRPSCRTCRKAQRKEDYKNSPEQQEIARERAAKWFLDNREQARQTRKKQYYGNREENIRKTKEWRMANPERYKEHNRKIAQSYKTDPIKKLQKAANVRNRRAKLRQAEGKHTAKDIQEIFEYQNGLCFYCKNVLVKFEVDHFYPVSKGGANSKDNLVIACPKCNKAKGDKLPQDFMREIGLM